MTETLTSPLIIKSEDHLEDSTLSFARDVLTGLHKTPKRLSSIYFYDERGSQIFEQICELDEYYLTRRETAILEKSADEIIARLPANSHLIELGSGSSTKTRILLEAAIARHPATKYSPIDVSSEILTDTVNDLHQRYPTLLLEAVVGRYEFGLEHILRQSTTPSCIMWLGSSIGNLTRSEATDFLKEVHAQLKEDDCLLLGIDLRKGAEVLEPAYDDAQGITAAFNLNLLHRINSELGGTFEIGKFKHQAIYNDKEGRVEMSLVSMQEQQVELQHLGSQLDFKKGEVIVTEYSYKYSQQEINALAEAAGFFLEHQWMDDEGWFSLNHFKPQRHAHMLRAT